MSAEPYLLKIAYPPPRLNSMRVHVIGDTILSWLTPDQLGAEVAKALNSGAIKVVVEKSQ